MENQVRRSVEEEGARGSELMWAGDMNGLPTGWAILPSTFQLLFKNLDTSTKLLELCFKERTSYTFYRSSNYTILKRAVETKEMCPSQAPGTMESTYGCERGRQPTLRFTFISHFDKDMGALMDGTFQRKNNTSKALEIHYWVKGGGRQQSNRHRLVAQLCILEGCKSPLFHEEGAP